MIQLTRYEVFYHCKHTDLDFIITPEGSSLTRLQQNANKKRVNYIGGFNYFNSTGVALVKHNGEVLDKRFKVVYPAFTDRSKSKTDPIRTFRYKETTILPLICYEIVFPRLWMKKEFKPDFVTHHVGFPMFDVFQLEGWRALQEAIAIFFNCDVVCSCGGTLKTPMNLSGIIKPKDKVFDYAPLYKDYRGEH